MHQSQFPAAELAEAMRLLHDQRTEAAVALYEGVLREHRAVMHRQMTDAGNLATHKLFLKSRLYLQMASQSQPGEGFVVNFGDYCFLSQPCPDFYLGPKTIAALERFKAHEPSMHRLIQKAPKAISDNVHAVAMVYYAHMVSPDIVDLLLLQRGRPMGRVADLGAGAELQAATLATMEPGIAWLHLYEVQDYMCDSIADLCAHNRVTNYTLNEPLPPAVDCFYSFRACGYMFSVDEYFTAIERARAAKSWALMDIGFGQDRSYQRLRLETLFGKGVPFDQNGTAPFDYVRTLFEAVLA